MELIAVAAVADNLVIGDEGELPWDSLPEDRRQYRERVEGEVVILGRRTFESMRDDLPGRAQIVLSRTERDYDGDTAHHAESVEEAVEVAASLGADRAYVLGGAEVYALFQPHLDRMLLTRVPGEYAGDAYFPHWDGNEWRLLGETAHDDFTVEEWKRDPAAARRP